MDNSFKPNESKKYLVMNIIIVSSFLIIMLILYLYFNKYIFQKSNSASIPDNGEINSNNSKKKYNKVNTDSKGDSEYYRSQLLEQEEKNEKSKSDNSDLEECITEIDPVIEDLSDAGDKIHTDNIKVIMKDLSSDIDYKKLKGTYAIVYNFDVDINTVLTSKDEEFNGPKYEYKKLIVNEDGTIEYTLSRPKGSGEYFKGKLLKYKDYMYITDDECKKESSDSNFYCNCYPIYRLDLSEFTKVN